MSLQLDENKEFVEDDIPGAFISQRGVVEGYLYKTSQKTGFFTVDLFHKRFYRLSLFQEELKVFDKQEGSIKQTIGLSQRVMYVTTALRNSLDSTDSLAMGTNVKLPPFLCPFAVFTDTEIMLLWASNTQQRDMWVDAFNTLMLGTDPKAIEKFKPVKTRSNAFVYGFFQLLKIGGGKNARAKGSLPTDVGQKRSRTLAPTSRAMKHRDNSAENLPEKQPEEEKKEDASDINNFQFNNLTKQDSKKALDSHRDQLEWSKRTPSKLKADLEKQLEGMASDEESKAEFRASLTKIDVASARKSAAKLEQTQEVESKTGQDKPDSEEVAVKNDVMTKPEVELIKQSNEAAESSRKAEQKVAEVTKRIENLKSSIVSQPDDVSEVNQDRRPGRRYRAASREKQTKPIKVKKFIPLKESQTLAPSTEHDEESKAATSLHSIFTGQKQLTTSSGFFQKTDTNLESENKKDLEDSDDDDDIERDPAAEIIKPQFRRSMNSARQRQIKVQLRRRKSSVSKNDGMSDTANYSKINVSDRFKVNRTTVGTENFEEKVQNQSDKQFIENLIASTTKLSAKGASISESKNRIADDLRQKIKMSAEQMQSVKKQLITQLKPPLDPKKEAENQQTKMLRLSLGTQNALGPIKAVDTGNCMSTRAHRGVNQTELKYELKNQHQRSITGVPNLLPIKATVQNQVATETTPANKKERNADKENQEEQVSDWDEDSDGAIDIGKSGHGRRKSRASSTVVNVRDRTSGLSNVFANKDLSKYQGYTFTQDSSRGLNSSRAFSQKGSNSRKNAEFKNSFTSHNKQYFNVTKDQEMPDDYGQKDSNQYQKDADHGTGPAEDSPKSVNEEDQIKEQIVTDTKNRLMGPQDPCLEVPPNENDCLAESYASVWD